MTNDRLEYLLGQFHKDQLTPDENEELELWYNTLYYNQIETPVQARQSGDQLLSEFRSEYLQRHSRPPAFRIGRKILAVAAVCSGIFFILAMAWLFIRKDINKTHPETAKATIIPDDRLSPGNPVLILADGSRVNLAQAETGLLARQGSVEIFKTADGDLRYQDKGPSGETFAMNQVITPRGTDHKIMLPDGTEVWMNAASSVSFPAAFAAQERKIQVTGEVYLEVSKDVNRPFKVSVGNQVISVLGTRFNVCAYPDEGPERVTLVEGSVEISSQGRSAILRPGQQSHILKNTIVVEEADVEQAIAWRAGFFEFNHSNLQTVMRSVSRWYDVDVRYQDYSAGSILFGGRINKHLPLPKVLEILKDYGIHSKIEGKNLTISSYPL